MRLIRPGNSLRMSLRLFLDSFSDFSKLKTDVIKLMRDKFRTTIKNSSHKYITILQYIIYIISVIKYSNYLLMFISRAKYKARNLNRCSVYNLRMTFFVQFILFFIFLLFLIQFCH